MDPVFDSFLLTVAEISAGLTDLFLVGMIVHIQTGYDRHEWSRVVVEPYFRVATPITFILHAIPLGVSLTLVALPIVRSRRTSRVIQSAWSRVAVWSWVAARLQRQATEGRTCAQSCAFHAMTRVRASAHRVGFA